MVRTLVRENLGMTQLRLTHIDFECLHEYTRTSEFLVTGLIVIPRNSLVAHLNLLCHGRYG